MTGAKKILAWAKGFRGRAKNCISIARERVEKALQYSYRDRKNKKRDFRGLWIQRINAGAREHGVRTSPARLCRSLASVALTLDAPLAGPQLKYSQLMYGLAAENIMINRKALSELAINEPQSFKVRRCAARRGSALVAASR